jgi:hypothetical protein
MTTLADVNVTYAGLSCDIGKVEEATADDEIRRIATESLLATHPDIAQDALQHYVVDRFNTPEGGRRIYVRPKVPFGADNIERELEGARGRIKDAALDAGQAVAELQSLLIDILKDPDTLAHEASRRLSDKFIEVNEEINKLQGEAAAITLLTVVKG